MAAEGEERGSWPQQERGEKKEGSGKGEREMASTRVMAATEEEAGKERWLQREGWRQRVRRGGAGGSRSEGKERVTAGERRQQKER